MPLLQFLVHLQFPQRSSLELALRRRGSCIVYDNSKFRTPDMLYPKPVRFLTLGLRGLRVCEREAHSKLSAGKHRVGLVQRLAKGFGDSRPMG